MPQVTVYVREDDLDQWKAIEKKSEFIHDALIMAKLPPEVLKTHTAPTKATTLKGAVKQPEPPTFAPITAAKLEVKPSPKEYKSPPSAASQIIKTPEQAKKAVDTPQFIDKKYSARKPGSKERHIDL